MPAEITLTIPDDILEQAQREADAVHRPLPEVLTDVLRQVYPAVAVHPQRARMLREVEAFHRMHAQLVTTHLGQFVAVKDRRVVDDDADFDALIDRVRERFGDNAIVMVDQVLPAQPAKQPRLPRLLREE